MPDTPETPAPNRFDTSTVVGLITAWWVVLEPVLDGAGVWLQAHTAIVFPAGYGLALKAAVLATASALVTRWHAGEG